MIKFNEKMPALIIALIFSLVLITPNNAETSAYGTAVRGGCPSVAAFFNLAPNSPCYGQRCTRAQCQADCDRSSTCAGYEFDGYDQAPKQPGYCFMLSKSCPVPLDQNGEDYRTRWTYMKLRMSFKDDVPITYTSINKNRSYQLGKTGPRRPTYSSSLYKRPLWRNAKNAVATTRETVRGFSPPPKIYDMPNFVTIRGGCPSPTAFMTIPRNFVCYGRRCQKVDCSMACLSSPFCIGFEFDAWDQAHKGSTGYCWLLKSTCSSKLRVDGEDFVSRWTYLRRHEDKKRGKPSSKARKLLVKLGTLPHSHAGTMDIDKFIMQSSKGKKTNYLPGLTSLIDPSIIHSKHSLVPKMKFIHGWNLQQPYMMSIGGCSESPGGGSLVYLSMKEKLDTIGNGVKGYVSAKQCLFHQCSRFDCENTCNIRTDCVGYEFASVSHGLTNVGYCHLLKRPCPADQRSPGAVFLTRLTYLKAE